ncbi:PREDICTED: uncharacterized protein LOC105556050 [Vollenhovia emeryi]|uniref:uncharacterized protein LOC105556050 n=1 Tax=Vollenhovia emeryi TaxID=411798 RepID=UPI0005F41A41|nr:PREDICTED: uncharacterized protein LOC105556050 [Vollenhovia emeryi]
MADNEESTEQEMDQEVQHADEYRRKYQQAKVEVTRLEEETQQRNAAPPVQGREYRQNNLPYQENKGTFKLPKIELKKFSGDVREWLQFWSQFKNIHEDQTVSKEDKFQYLLQAMVPDTRASELVNSYPPTADNYDKVIAGLKSRFGKNELLVEVYVRELLKLVLSNAITPKGNVSLSSVYDRLETHIRSLESLGVTTDTCAAMLYPLVESSLPEDLLRAWQRHTSTTIQLPPREPGDNAPAVPVATTPKDRLTNLMAFLQAEVENEERIAMAVSGFGLNQEQSTIKDKVKRKHKGEATKEIATASTLLTTKEGKTQQCIFCSENHDSSQCEKARKMPMEERQNIVKQKNACFNCLKAGHSSRFCKYKQKCAWCGRKHVLLMCRGMTADRSTTKNAMDESAKKQEESSLTNLSFNEEIFLQTLQVKLRNRGRERIARVVLDTGSHRSYVLSRTAKEMDYEEVGQQNIIHLLFGGAKTEPQEHKGYRIRISSLDDSYACNFVALGQETICNDIPGIRRGPWIQELSHKGIKLTDVGQVNEPISILIGADIVGKLLTGKLQDLECGATAIETRLGWTVMGKNSQGKTARVDSALLTISMFAQDAKISDLWSLDILGITDPVQTKTKESHQEQVKDYFRQTVTVNNAGRYEVYLPWKESHPPLSDNKEIAVKRLEMSIKRLKSDNLFEDYCRVLEEWAEEGIIEPVPPTEVDNHSYYLPHRPVLKENSTTRLRPVFDASARGKDSPSLNQCLEIGPNLIELIPTMLLRFRERRIGVISDIKKAFLQISVSPKERDVLRFLWWNKEDSTKLEVYRHCRVVFGVTSSPFLLGATIQLHLERVLQQATLEEQRDVIRKLEKSFYVDNCVTSVDTYKELKWFKEEATAAMSTGGFLLRGWEYSDPTLIQDSTPVLGLTWNKGQDTLSLTKSALEESMPEKVTKRRILSATQKIFDPIGLVCPVLRPKLLLQKLWSTDLDWDTEVNEEVKNTFREWHQQLSLLTELRIPRWIFGDERRGYSTSFHVFVDASQDAYAAVLFARTESPSGVKVQLIEAKARVAPLGKSTIPRLELLAATIGARLMTFTLGSLGRQQAEKYFWSDSMTVLSWIKQEKQWATFVWNRTREIRQLTEPEHWYHLPGSMNPADLPSRGCSTRQLLDSKWWEGPEWLRKSREQWPSVDYIVDETEVNKEIKKSTFKVKKAEASVQCEVAMSNTCKGVPDREGRWYLRGSFTFENSTHDGLGSTFHRKMPEEPL